MDLGNVSVYNRVVLMMLKMKFERDKMEAKKLNRYDKAYLGLLLNGEFVYCKRKQVGAIIVRDRMIISDGYNGTPTGFENCCEDDEGLRDGMFT
jgi:dCMP deaminase